MSELIKSVPLVSRNLMGLRPAQASLYKYMKKCADEQTTVEMEAVVKIYWEEVKPAEKPYRDGWYNSKYANPNDPIYSILHKNIPAYYKTYKEGQYYGYWIERPARQWMQHTVGSLVMRGLLTVIPNFDIKIIEDDRSYNNGD